MNCGQDLSNQQALQSKNTRIIEDVPSTPMALGSHKSNTGEKIL